MTENMKYWEQLDKPPQEALKKIEGVPHLRGKTSIDPQWRIKRMTEVFGPVGVGWYSEIEEQWLESFGSEVCAFTRIKVYIQHEGDWSKPIPGIGGSMIATVVKRNTDAERVDVSDDAYKKSYTDALGVAMKALGVASKIYENKWDGSKYQDTTPKEPIKKINAEQVELVKCEMASLDVDNDKFFEYIGCKSVEEMTTADFDRALKALTTKRKAGDAQ